jgi:hypothetical protein
VFSLALFSRARPSSFLPRLAHVLTHSPHAPPHSPTSACRDTDLHPPLPPFARHWLLGPPRPRRPPPRGATAPTPPTPSCLLVAPPAPDPSPFPFSSRSKAADALCLSPSFCSRAQHRGSPAPFSPSPPSPCTGLERRSAATLAEFTLKRRHRFPPQ